MSDAAALMTRADVDGASCAWRSCACGGVLTAEHDAVRLTMPTGSVRAMRKVATVPARLLDCWASPKGRILLHGKCFSALQAALKAAEKPAAKRAKRSDGTAATAAVVMPDEEQDLVAASLEACDPERFDAVATTAVQAKQVAALLRAAKRAVAFTGAGISVAAGIPDYRGTAGVDVVGFEAAAATAGGGAAVGGAGASSSAAAPATASTAGGRSAKAKPAASTTALPSASAAGGLHGLSSADELAAAMSASETYTQLQPTYAHRALATLHAEGRLQMVITQNCDGLHRRAGVPRDGLCVLHGDVYTEYCEACSAEYERPFCVDTYSTEAKKEKWYKRCPQCRWNHYTGRLCAKPGCAGKLRDTIVNFGDDLHESVLGGLPLAKESCKRADVIMCLGSSLTVTPACDLPRLRKAGAAIVIVNLQATELDDHASVAVRAFCKIDDFMRLVMRELQAVDGGSATSTGAGAAPVALAAS